MHIPPKKPGATGYQEWAREIFTSHQFFAETRKAISLSNLKQLRTGKVHFDEPLDGPTAIALLQEIEEGLTQGYFLLEEIETTPEAWARLCDQYGHTSFYRYFAMPETFGSAAKATFCYPIEGYSNCSLLIQVEGRFHPPEPPSWIVTADIQTMNGRRENLSSAQLNLVNPNFLLLESPERIASESQWMCEPVVDLKLLSMGVLRDPQGGGGYEH